MKKNLLLFSLCLGLSCSDGNFEIASFEFNETVNICGTYTLYRYGLDTDKEVLMITLTEDVIRQEEVDIEVNIAATSKNTVTYRIFDSDVDSNYFCAVVPPFEPKTKKNYEGIGGKMLVRNTPVYDEDGQLSAYEHIIVLNDVILESNSKETIKFDQDYLFGTFQTILEQ